MSADARRPQHHGGALRNGGPNRGGPGRSPSPVLQALQLDPTAALARLVAIADGRRLIRISLGGGRRVKWVTPTANERINACRALLEISLEGDDRAGRAR